MTNRWTVTFSREQIDAMWAKIDIDAIIARVVSGGYDGASSVAARIRELEALVKSYAATNEAQRKRIDELLGKLAELSEKDRVQDAVSSLAVFPPAVRVHSPG